MNLQTSLFQIKTYLSTNLNPPTTSLLHIKEVCIHLWRGERPWYLQPFLARGKNENKNAYLTVGWNITALMEKGSKRNTWRCYDLQHLQLDNRQHVALVAEPWPDLLTCKFRCHNVFLVCMMSNVKEVKILLECSLRTTMELEISITNPLWARPC